MTLIVLPNGAIADWDHIPSPRFCPFTGTPLDSAAAALFHPGIADVGLNASQKARIVAQTAALETAIAGSDPDSPPISVNRVFEGVA